TSWSTNTPGFLQSTHSLSPINWTNVTNAVSVVGTQDSVTNGISGVPTYYRLTFSPYVVVRFNDLTDGPLNGTYAGLDWGTGVWTAGGPWAGIHTENAGFVAAGPPSTGRISAGASGAFRLKSLRATADSAWTLDLIDNHGQTASLGLSANTPAILTTGWALPSDWVDVTSSVGYNAV